jgi:hypothetical protein
VIKVKKWIKMGGAEGTAPQKKSILVEKEKSVIKVTYETKGFWNIKSESKFEEIQVPDIGQNLEPGEPALPQEGLYVGIPVGATISDIKVVNEQKKTIKLNEPVKPAATPTVDKRAAPEFIPKKDIYEKEDTFPGVLFKDLGIKQLGDVNVLHLMMFPVQYHPLSKTIDLYTKIELEITYERNALRAIPTRGGRKRVPPGYEDQILNFDNI